MLPIFHRQRECIGCESCVEISPNYFRMNKDGLAELIESTKVEEPYIHAQGFEEDRESLTEAAAACPVHIILLDRP